MSDEKQPKVHWSTGEGNDYGWMVGQVEGSRITCRHDGPQWEIYLGSSDEGTRLRRGLIQAHQVDRATARAQRVVSLYEVAEGICEANARVYARKEAKPSTSPGRVL
jgi:hypothetical protein